MLGPGTLVCFAEGPVGAHRLLNYGESTARLITFSTPIGRPTSTFYPDEETVVIHVPGHGGLDSGLTTKSMTTGMGSREPGLPSR